MTSSPTSSCSPPVRGPLRIAGAMLLACSLIPAAANAQTLTWKLRDVSGPSPRSGHGMVFDASRGVTVLFGGYGPGGVASGETWEWDGTQWIQSLAPGPSPRFGFGMTYDSARGVTVLFGGNAGGANNETWEWNGAAWTQHTVDAPPAWYGQRLAFDADRGVTLLFEHTNDISFSRAQTWEWNGAAWTQIATSGPSGRIYHGMAYDAGRRRSVLFGGFSQATTPSYNGDTWEWNGVVWMQRASGGPSPRYGQSMAFDSTRGVCLLFGGYNGQTRLDDMWVWDGVQWAQSPVHGPTARSQAAMAYDSSRRTLILFGGFGGAYSGETWELAECAADFDGGGLGTSDTLAFLNAWFVNDPRADFDHDGEISSADILAFMDAWLAGCG